MAKVLVAIRPEDAELMRRVFGDEFDLVACATLADAKDRITDELEMIACGVHFDDGRMFELLKWVKEDPRLAHIPFWGILRDEGLLSLAITRGIRTAMKSMGANGLFNLSQLDSGGDEDRAYQTLRGAIRQSLSDQA
jgi:hypothetical protein